MSDSSELVATDPEHTDWDVVIVGTGVGGSSAGYALARKGKRVLFVEQGHFQHARADKGTGELPFGVEDDPTVRLMRGEWPRKVQGKTDAGPLAFHAPLGCGTGGTSTLYAAQLERMLPADLAPRRLPKDAPEVNFGGGWPITYDELRPYYREAETLFRVCGTQDPLYTDEEARLREPPPIAARDRLLFDSFVEAGLHPYRAHVGCKYVPGCQGCAGALCPRSCKSDAGTVALMPALREHGARILPECEVLKLEADAHRVTAVHCRTPRGELRIGGKIVILAAGSYMSPVLLLRSRSTHWPDGLANAHDLVGRNLMFHTDNFMAVHLKGDHDREGPAKAISLNDFYVDGDDKLGTVQSLGIPVNGGSVMAYLQKQEYRDPKWWRKAMRPAMRVVADTGAYMFRDAATFTAIVEDYPYLHNRIVLDDRAPDGRRFEYRYSDELRRRNARMRDRVASTIGKRHRTMPLSGENNLNYGHVCGTCRFGNDPETSVLDRNNRAHGVDNLYVVDSSCFPTSGGTNPSLTIAANALRAAAAID